MGRSVVAICSKLQREMPTCPTCDSTHVVKNGRIHNGKQNHKCRRCRRQFVEHPANKIISDETKTIIDGLLLERISLAGIARATGVSETWLQSYVNRKYKEVPRSVEANAKKRTSDNRVR